MFTYEKLTFCKLEREDLPKLLELKIETWPNTHNTAIVSLEDQERWFDSLDKDIICPRNLILLAHITSRILDHSGGAKQAINHVGIFKIFNVHWVNRTADVAWDVFKEMRGQAFGELLVAGGIWFCVDMLGLRRLDAEILEHNEASRKCAEAVGFVQEGVRRQAVFKSGGYLDSIIFGFLKNR